MHKPYKKRSPIWQLDTEKLRVIVDKSDTFKEVLQYFGLPHKGGNSKTLKQRLDRDNIDYSKFKANVNNIQRFKPVVDTALMMTTNSQYSRSAVKRRVIKEGLLENKCAICGMTTQWQGKPLVLVLDHINGVGNDHRLKNLQLLCPNCNSQTDTFCGRNKAKINNCIDCGIKISRSATRCHKCRAKYYQYKKRKVERPSLEQLEKDTKELGFCGTGRKYGVSDNAIRKWINYYKHDIYTHLNK